MFTKKEIASLIGVVAAIIIPKLIFPDEIYEYVEPLDDTEDQGTDYTTNNK